MRLGDVLAELRGVAHVVGEHRAEELDRVVGLQIGSLVGDYGVGGGVGFVKAIAGELLQQVEDLIRLGRRNVVLLLAALDEGITLLGHLFRLLLAHGAAEQVGAAQRVASKQLRGLHHLLLINQDAVGLLGNLLQQWMLVFDRDLAVAALDEFRDEVHRAGPVERHERGDVLDGADLKLPAEVAHPARFQLEDAERVGLVQQVVSLGVVERQRVNGHFHTLGLAHHFAGVADDGKGLEPEEVHLQQAQFADGIHRILRDDGAVLVGLEREQIHQRLRADDDAGGVDGSVARDVLQHLRRLDQLVRHLFALVGRLEFRRLLERFIQRHLQVEGNHLRQPVALAVAKPHDPANVAHHGLGAHRAEGDDLGH